MLSLNEKVEARVIWIQIVAKTAILARISIQIIFASTFLVEIAFMRIDNLKVSYVVVSPPIFKLPSFPIHFEFEPLIIIS
jgi:hypothetical protein